MPNCLLSFLFSLCVLQSICYHCCLHLRPRTSILCHWSKYKLLTTHIFPQNSDKTREWAKPLSLLFYYCSPQHPHLRPAISLKPVRVSASRMDRLMGGRRCLSVFVRVYVCVWARTCVHKPKVVFMLHVFEYLVYFIDYGQMVECDQRNIT